jgi:hypothetical protein
MRAASLIAFVALSTLAAPGARAQQPAEEELALRVESKLALVPKLQYRPRYLVHGGRDFGPEKLWNAVSHRARLGVEARLASWLAARVELQDVRSWGEELGTFDAAADGFDVHQAWAELRCPLGLALRAGRQEVAFDNERLIGAVDWSDPGRSFDGVRASLRRSSVELDLLWAKLGEKNAYVKDAAGKAVRGAPEDADLAALRVRLTTLPALRPTLLGIYDYQGESRQHRVTTGLYFDGEPLRGLRYSGELYYQAGRRRAASGPEMKIAAFLGAVSISYAAPVRTAPTLRVWYEHLSGDDDLADTTVRAFDTLYATNHKFYGLMDLFLNIPVDASGLGLVDAGGRASLDPARWLALALDYHHFEQARRHPITNTTTLGNELDLVARVKINRHLAVEGAAGVFFPKLGISNLRGGGTDTEGWGYLQLDLQL